MSNLDISKLLQESKTPLEQMNSYSRTLAPKWERTGLLDNLTERDRGAMSVLLENQARQLLKETSFTNSAGSSGEQWSGVALPLVRKVFAEIAAKEFVSVQPMNLPSGLIFYLDFQYGTTVGQRTARDSVYGDTTSSAAPAGGLYGAGRFAYTINDFTASFSVVTANAGLGNSASVNYETTVAPSSVCEVTIPLSNLSGADKAAIRAFVPSGSGFTTWYPQYTRLNTAQDSVIFVIPSGAASPVNIGKVTYTKQPVDTGRGDFEDTVGSSIPPTGVDLVIPEINIELRSEAVVAKSRKLKAVWTPELAQDLNAYHSIDAEAELTAILSEHIALEIDLEILDMLLVYAKTTGYWSATIGRVWNGSAFVNDTNLSAQAWTAMTWYQTLGNKLQAVSNEIHRLTLRGGANWVVVSPTVATIIETIPGFTAKTDGTQASFAMGVTQVGSFMNRFTVYKNPYITGNVVLMGFRGSNFLETGAVYAPYVPLIMTPLVYDPQNFTPRRGVMTRYAKKMVRPEFFGKILIEDLAKAL
jgi:hypothetical protein